MNERRHSLKIRWALGDDSPPALDVLAVVALVGAVELEAHRRFDFDRHRPDSDRQAHLIEGAHHLAVEVGDGSRRQGHRPASAVGGVDDELMIDEVEHHAEGPVLVRQELRAQAPRRHQVGDGPAVVQRHAVRERDLADDLRPHVQGGIGVLPRLVRQRRPRVEGRLGTRQRRHPDSNTTSAHRARQKQLRDDRCGARGALAWRLGDESQQRVSPHVWQVRRCNHREPLATHSTHSCRAGGVIDFTASRWPHAEALMARRAPRPARSASRRRASLRLEGVASRTSKSSFHVSVPARAAGPAARADPDRLRTATIRPTVARQRTRRLNGTAHKQAATPTSPGS